MAGTVTTHRMSSCNTATLPRAATCRHAPPRAAHVSDLGAGGVPQLLDGVVAEVAQRDGEYLHGAHPRPVGRRDHRAAAQSLNTIDF